MVRVMKIIKSLRLISGWITAAGLTSAGFLAAYPASAQIVDIRQETGTDRASPNLEALDGLAIRDEKVDPAIGRTRNEIESSKGRGSYTPDRIDQDHEGPSREIVNNYKDFLGRQFLALPNEFENYASKIADKPLYRFGANLLVPSSRDFNVPTTTAVPPDYRINPGDEIDVGLSGSVNADNLRLRVDPDGNIFLPRIGGVRVAGVRYGDLQSVLAAKVSRQYQGFQVSVSIAKLHGITVYVTGFAQVPGSYTVNSLSTLINALLAAGGPSSGGSFRSIQLRRNGKLVSDFDLYDFLLKGDKSADAILQNGDVIFIAPVGAQVAVIGSVNNEAVFEAKTNDTLTEVLIYAGGVNTGGDDTRLLELDTLSTDNGWIELTPGDASSRAVKRASVLRVISRIGLATPLRQQSVLITLQGEVAKPGRYYLPAGTTLAEAIDRAGGLTEDAFPYGATFTRVSVAFEQREGYARALGEAELKLTAEPLISGRSANQNAQDRMLATRSLIAQLKKQKPDGRFLFPGPPGANVLPEGLVIHNNDSLYVPSVPTSVGVYGMVVSQSNVQYQPGKIIGDYLAAVGGARSIGSLKDLFVVRANGTVLAKQGGLFSAGVKSQPALPGDLIFVPPANNTGAFFERLAVLSQTLLATALSAATIVAVAK